jgi:chromatin remodeling complex protein RSC6
VVAFCQGVRDEKMLEKLATHDVQDVSSPFSLADKCTKAIEGRTWHSPAAQAAKGESKPSARAQAQGGANGKKKKKKKKKAGGTQPLAKVPTAIAAMAGGGYGGLRGDKRPRQLSNSNDGSTKYPGHNPTRHTMSYC